MSHSIDSYELPVLDALMLDAEGSEPSIIRGALDTLKRCRPFIITETVTDDMAESLTELGYQRGPDFGGDASFYNE